MNVSSVIFDPLLPWGAIAGFAVLVAAMIALAFWRGLAGWAWRLLAGALILGAIANPSLQFEEQDPLPDIVLALVDDSASQGISDRTQQTEAALARLEARLSGRSNTELRVARIGDGDNNTGTQAMAALRAELTEIPAEQMAGVVVISDGQVHDADTAPGLGVPLHLLMTGRPGDWDRRLVVTDAPAYAILGEPVTLTVRIEDQGAVPANVSGLAELAVSVDGGAPSVVPARVGADFDLEVTLPHGGINVIHLSLAEEDGELTDRNNGAVVQINGVRDRLRVLLVSGEPYAGGRTWRNLLKSDSAVDLVHFTILRPPSKQDGVPVTELSLIAFPTRELFLDKIDEFDLIIFDRYRLRGILPTLYIDSIRDYVTDGGAVLLAAGPEFAGANSLFYSPLGDVLPIAPTSRVTEARVMPEISELGARHPVTAGLGPDWGPWMRQVELEALSGQTVMTGLEGRPLLVLDRVGDGRVAVLGSDQAWLWARGFEGGGPQLDLLRRLAHWMMKEPDLEEEALSVQAEGQRMVVTRRSLSDTAPALTITRPDGEVVTLDMTQEAPGRFVAEYDGPVIGLYRLTNGELQTVAALGPSAPKEFEQTVASENALEPLISATGGGVAVLSAGMPDLRWVGEGRVSAGRGWLGLYDRDAARTLSVRLVPMLPVWLALLLAASLPLIAWIREGRR